MRDGNEGRGWVMDGWMEVVTTDPFLEGLRVGCVEGLIEGSEYG